MKALIVEPRSLLTADVHDAGDARRFVLGGVDAVHHCYERRSFRAFWNRDAAARGLQMNVLGTLLFRAFGIVEVGEVVNGNVMLFGTDDSGAETDVPDWIVELAEGMVPEARALNGTRMCVAN